MNTQEKLAVAIAELEFVHLNWMELAHDAVSVCRVCKLLNRLTKPDTNFQPLDQFKDKPDCEGSWWFDHSTDPLTVRKLRAYGGNLMVLYEREWCLPDELPNGLWIGPLEKPSFPKQPELHPDGSILIVYKWIESGRYRKLCHRHDGGWVAADESAGLYVATSTIGLLGDELMNWPKSGKPIGEQKYVKVSAQIL